MYSIVENILNFTGSSSYNYESYIIYTCAALTVILTVVFIDLVYRVFTHFWRGGK